MGWHSGGKGRAPGAGESDLSASDFREAVRSRTLVADGAMGTQLRAYLHGEDREGALELLNLSRPELVMHVHREYAEAGADLLITNTFGASTLRSEERRVGKECRARWVAERIQRKRNDAVH